MKLKLLHVGIAAAAVGATYYLYQKRKEQTPLGMASATSGPRPHRHHHHRRGGRRGGWGGYSVYGRPDYPLVIERTPSVYYENVWDGQKWVLVQRVL